MDARDLKRFIEKNLKAEHEKKTHMIRNEGGPLQDKKRHRVQVLSSCITKNNGG